MSTLDGPVTYVRRTAPRYTSAMTIRGKVADTGVGDELELNPRYFVTIPGIIKIIEIIFGLIALCCISPPLTWFSRLFTLFQALSFAITILLCFSYLVSLQRALWPTFNWLLAELIFTIVASITLGISAILHIAYTCRDDYRFALTYHSSYIGTSYFYTYIVAGIFGLLNFLAYGAGSYFLYYDWKHPDNTVRPVGDNNNEVVHY